MPEIVLHQLEISPFCDKVRRVLAYKGLAYRVRNVPMAELGKLRRLSPAGKVPILELDGAVLHDSSDICRALDKAAPSPPLFPENPQARAQVDILEDWADESLYFFEMTMRFTWPYDRQRWVTQILKYDNPVMRRLARPLVPFLTRKQGVQQGLARRTEADILSELDRHLAALAQLLVGTDYLVAGTLTLADIAIVSQLDCVAGSGKGLAAVGRQPAVVAWMERVESQTGGPALR
ncbi:glutathione S-transferase family protein [Sphingobium sp.]|jgi:glutathione S-transferase|uniref:glutathione S-transferase family protein n=1 Tax=Sphingobium sp. TaxID=1912891 RepID=UPI002C69EDEE|nr:glutathione S-transferase family protein [Sphingobium sp.]HUD93491.1 glutathione S-transferase family protein [Sphingobium sp.]